MTTIISRRGFLRIGCCSVAALGLTGLAGKLGLMSAIAEGATPYQALVCIFLLGGSDSNNVLIPTDSRYAQYQQMRANLALAEASLLPIAASDGTPYGLHPNFPEIQHLYNQKVAAFVTNVGVLVGPTDRAHYLAHSVPVPANLFSHSDQQTQWQSSIPDTIKSTSGWGGRIADVLTAGGMLPVGVSVAGNDLFLNGATTSPATIIPGARMGLLVGNPASKTAFQNLLSFDSGFSLVQASNTKVSSGIQFTQTLNNAFAGAQPLGVTFPNTGLGDQLKQIAQVIQVRTQLNATQQIFFCSLDGFDTHSNELSTQAALLQQLSQAIDAFYHAMVSLGVQNSVTAFTASDFNRTFQPNSTNGSDHAWGNHHLVVGGAVKGGNLYGTFPELALNTGDDANNRGVWIPTISTDQYGATLASWFGISASNIATIFPDLANFTTGNLGFMQ